MMNLKFLFWRQIPECWDHRCEDCHHLLLTKISANAVREGTALSSPTPAISIEAVMMLKTCIAQPETMIVSHFPCSPPVSFTLSNVGICPLYWIMGQPIIRKLDLHIIFDSLLANWVMVVIIFLFQVAKEENK